MREMCIRDSRYPALNEGDEVVRYTPPTVKPGEPLEGEIVILDLSLIHI